MSADASLEFEFMGLSGHVAGWEVFTHRDALRVIEDAEDPRQAGRTVDGLGEFVQGVEDLRLGWAEFEDGSEVVYLYDPDDDGFGYGFNIDAPHLSEWGYAPFRGDD